MKIIEYLILGFIQGITEPIPVSSSGHILIFKALLGNVFGNIKIDYEVLATLTNFGSFLAILLFFRKDIIRLVGSFFTFIFNKRKRKDENTKNNYKYCWYIVLGSIPVGILGLLVEKLDIFDFLEENIKFVGLMLVVTSLFLYLIKDFKGFKDKADITAKDALLIGFAQVIALIPGISSSGATIVGSMYRGLDRETAFNFSFMLYLPVSIATGLLGVLDLMELNLSVGEIIYYLLATFMAFIFTYIATAWFNKAVKQGKLMYFSIYCLIVGILVVMFL